VPDDSIEAFSRLSVGQALCGTAAASVEPVIAERLHERTDDKAAAAKALGFRAYACHPLLVGDRLLGTLSFASKVRDRFEPDEIEFMQTICRYVAAAKDRMRFQREASADLTERKRAEEQSALYRTIISRATDGIALIDRDARYLEQNLAHRIMLGYSDEDLRGQTPAIHAESEAFQRVASQLIDTGRYQGEIRSRRKDGQWVDIALSAFAVYDDHGEVRCYVGIKRDVTEQKRYERDLAEQARLLDLSNDAIIVRDKDDRIRYWNHGAEDLYGWTDDEAIGRVSHDLLRTEWFQPMEEVTGTLLRDGRWTGEVSHRRKDGRRMIVASRWSLDRDAEGRPAAVLETNNDITARREAEQRLQLERERLALALTAGQMGVYDLDMVLDRLWWSPEIYQVFGVSPDRFVPTRERFTELVHPDDRDLLWKHLAEAIAERRLFLHEFRIARPDGSIRWIANRAQTEYDASGTPLRHLGIAIDITERKRAEEALQERERFVRSLIDTAPATIYVYDILHQKNVYTNPGATVSLGYTDVEMQEMGDQFLPRVMHPEDQIRIRDHFAKLAGLEDGAVLEFEYRMRASDGRWRWFLSRDTVYRRLPDGRVQEILGTATDMTARKESEAALRAGEERLRAILDRAPAAIFIKDREGRSIFMNEECGRVLGLDPGAAIGKTEKDLFPPVLADQFRRNDAAVWATGDAQTVEEHVPQADGPLTFLSQKFLLRDHEGTPYALCGIAVDITSRQRMEEELRRWKDELETRVQERTHELVASQERLRELASQLTMTEQRERQKLARDLHDYLAQMLVVGRMKMNAAKKQPGLPPASQTVLQDVDTIFQQALTYTRTLIGELSPPSFRDYGLPAALKWLSERMQKDGLWVDVECEREHVPLSEEHAVLMFQCVRELLFNVLKHAGVDRATVRVAVEPDGAVQVAVEDRGNGLDAGALRRAGEPGHLGLFAVRERMEAIGGGMDVTSISGKGTTVTITLPGK